MGGRALLYVDEPTTGLDYAYASDIVQLLREQCRAGRAVVAVTHDPLVIAAADTVVRLGET